MSTANDILKAAEDLPLVDLVAIGRGLFDLIEKKSTEREEVEAARAAGDIAVDALEKELTK